ncbi:MAG TPA: hypothetical protein VL282_09115 [Tepidisphaeraceae bacterium]|jgi:hypothetical protein|nr:hypothetical protein [Tepidisphaeraceae bacterium]
MIDLPRVRPISHLYAIQPSLDWFCGLDSGGRQVIMYPSVKGWEATFFDKSGDYLGMKEWELIPYHPTAGPGWREAQAQSIKLTAEKWTREIGLQSGTIRIHRGTAPEIPIEDWPAWMVEFMDDPSKEPEATRARYTKIVEDWWRDGCYVLWMGKDYWMSGNGEIEST